MLWVAWYSDFTSRWHARLFVNRESAIDFLESHFPAVIRGSYGVASFLDYNGKVRYFIPGY